MEISPARRELEEYASVVYEFPFGKSRSRNPLQNFYTSPAITDIKVLLFGCGDLHNALKIIASQSSSMRTLHIHINEPRKCMKNAARSILIFSIFSSTLFDPCLGSKDLEYLWSVWYDTCWSKKTAVRFQKDIADVLVNSLPDNVTLESANSLKELRHIWTNWLNCLKKNYTNPNFTSKILSKRSKFIEELSSHQPSTSEFCDTGTSQKTSVLISVKDYPENLRKRIVREERNYHDSGSTWPCNNGDSEAYINPTLINPDVSSKWLVHPAACPFNGYLPFSVSELEGLCNEEGFVAKYCKKKLSLLLSAYRQHKARVHLAFHIGNPLELCYSLSMKFNAIDCSFLAEDVGLVNVINAAERRLSEEPESALLIEVSQWGKYHMDASRYVEEALCVPPSVMPSLLGLRLADPIDRIGLSLPPDSSCSSVCLTFKRTPCFKNIKLQVASSWAVYFERLHRKCFTLGDDQLDDDLSMKMNTPLTFFYTMQAAAERSGRGNEPLFRQGLFNNCNPFFKLAARTFINWMWTTKSLHIAKCLNVNMQNITNYLSTFASVKLLSGRVRFNDLHTGEFMERKTGRNPLVRLVLVPTALLDMLDTKKTIRWHVIPDTHCIDNVRLDFRKSGDLESGWMAVSFPLVSDHGLAETHTGVVVDFPTGILLASIGPVKHLKEEYFSQVNPFANGGPEPPEEILGPILIQAGLSHTFPSCVETETSYNIRIRFDCPVNKESLNWFTDAQHPCRTAHHLTLTQKHPADMRTLSFDLPHPFYSEQIGVRESNDTEMELTLLKALDEPWPSEFISRPEWSADYLQPWPFDSLTLRTKSGFSDVTVHLERQYDARSKRLNCNPYSALDQVRQVISDIFRLVMREGHSFMTVRCLESENMSEEAIMETEPGWLIRVDQPIVRSPKGVPMLLVSAFDYERALELINKNDTTVDEVENEAIRLFFSKIPDETVVNSFLLCSREASNIFRYILRLNATKLTPSKSQIDNETLAESSPWLATFLSPRYSYRAPALVGSRC